MEIQLQELIDKIKKDGVEVAETEAEQILANAKTEAEKIIANAKVEAEKLLGDAKIEIERITKSSEDAIRQAGRNLLISFRESVNKQLETIIAQNVDAIYSSSDFSKIIANVIEKWATNPEAENVSLILGEDELKSLENVALASIKKEMLKGVTLKSSGNTNKGFKIAVDGANAYYDYSTESVVEMLSSYLNPKVIALLKEAE